MKRNFDVVREVLISVESLPSGQDKDYDESSEGGCHALLLYRAGFLEGINTSSLNGNGVKATGLTWDGHELLDILRSKPVWEKIKEIAQERGIELTFDSIKTIGAFVLSKMFS